MDDQTHARAEKVADDERAIQRDIDARDQACGDDKSSGAVQAGARPYPEPPFPKQHQTKPGDEAALPQRLAARLRELFKIMAVLEGQISFRLDMSLDQLADFLGEPAVSQVDGS